MRDSNMAWARHSSLKAHKSSRLPPPRASIRTSIYAHRFNNRTAALLVHANAAAGDNLHAVSDVKPHAQVRPAKHRRLELCTGVLEREVPVPRRRMAFETGHLARYPDAREGVLQQRLDFARQFAD